MTKHAPTNINSLYPTTADLIALYAVEGLPTGFDCYYDNPSPPSGGGGGTSSLNPYVFANSTNFFNMLKGEGFFTGGSPRLYYTPAVATALMAAGNITYNGYSINLIEYHMRTEGISTGCLGQSGTMHLAGDDDCTILANLQTEGYTTGAFEVASQADNALVDFECVDGRLYHTGCVALWHAQITHGPQPTAPTGCTEDTSKRIVTTFAAPTTIFCVMWSEGGNAAPRAIGYCDVDGNFFVGSDTLDERPYTRSAIMEVAKGIHTIRFFFGSVGNQAVNFTLFAFRQGG